MSVPVSMLVACGLLSLGLAVLTIAIHFVRFGGKMIRGNRDNYPIPIGLPARVLRAHANLNEVLLPFGILVFAAAAIHAGNDVMSNAAIAFFIARLAHAGLYLAGATPWRSLSYYAGLIATLIFAGQLLMPG
jgi:uncharacterized MAPEG superfamily protein